MLVDQAHKGDVVATLPRVALVDADGVDPERAGRVGEPQPKQSRVQVARDRDGAAVAQDLPAVRVLAPNVRQGFVRWMEVNLNNEDLDPDLVGWPAWLEVEEPEDMAVHEWDKDWHVSGREILVDRESGLSRLGVHVVVHGERVAGSWIWNEN